MIDDQESFQALLAGDENAWAALARRLHQHWRGLTVRSVGEGEADDLLQEVFVRVYTHRDTLRDPAHLSRFVRRVWNQRVVDHWRRLGVRARGAEDMRAIELEPSPQTNPDPAHHALRSELIGEIDQSSLLGAEQKLILKLHIFDELSLAEVARVLQRNAASVETWYYRALELLRLDIALSAYRDRRGDLQEHFSEQQRAALDFLTQGLSEKNIARRLGMRVPEVQELLAPALKTLCHVALGEWRQILSTF